MEEKNVGVVVDDDDDDDDGVDEDGVDEDGVDEDVVDEDVVVVVRILDKLFNACIDRPCSVFNSL